MADLNTTLTDITFASFQFNGIYYQPEIDENGWLCFRASDAADTTHEVKATPLRLKNADGRTAFELQKAAPEWFITDGEGIVTG